MFRFNYLAILAVLISNLAFSQAEKTVYGKISKEDLSRKSYPVDSTADCIILYEKATVNFRFDDNEGFYIETEIFVRKRILKASAIDQGTLNLPYYNFTYDRYEKYSDIVATSYWLEDGSINKMDIGKKDIFDEKLANNRKSFKITIPNVKEGGIIEYKYLKKSMFSLRDKPEAWYFQGKNPCLWSEYEITVPEHFYYQIIMGGYLPLVKNKSEKENVSFGHSKLDTYGTHYTWAVQNAPAFKDEPYITTADDYLSKIEFELSRVSLPNQLVKSYSTTWQKIAETLNNSESFGTRLRKNNFLRAISDQFEGITDKKEKLEKMYDYYKRQFTNENNDNSVFCSDLKKVFENKKGSSSELNLMFTAMLRDIDYDAKPVLLSTRANGRLNRNYALLDKLNYVITRVVIDEKVYLLDASNSSYSFNILPYKCLNESAFILEGTDGQFLDIVPSEKNRKFETVDLVIDIKNNLIKGKYSCTGNGYYAIDERVDYASSGSDKYQEGIKKDRVDYNISNLEILNFDKTLGATEVKYEFSKDSELEDSELIYLDPIIFPTFTDNPFKSDQRMFPINLAYNYDHVYSGTIKLPADYAVESMPRNIILMTPDKNIQVSYSLGYTKEDNTIKISTRFLTKKTSFFSDDYAGIKEFFKLMINKQNEKIVLKKIASK